MVFFYGSCQLSKTSLIIFPLTSTSKEVLDSFMLSITWDTEILGDDLIPFRGFMITINSTSDILW